VVTLHLCTRPHPPPKQVIYPPHPMTSNQTQQHLCHNSTR